MSYINREGIDYNTPDKILMDMEEYEPSNDDRTNLIHLLRDTVTWINQNECDSSALLLGVLYALEDPITLEKSTRKRAREMSIANGLISHYKTRYEREVLYRA
jgi:hypothetical protein